MNKQEMIQGLRAEIAKLQEVVDLLSEQPREAQPSRDPGRPKKAVRASTRFAPKVRQMSVEGKARIAAAQKKRWAKRKAEEPTASAKRKTMPPKRADKVTGPTPTKRGASVPAKKSSGRATKATSTSAKVAQTTAKGARKQATKKSAPKKAMKAAAKRSAPQASSSALQTESTE